ncbi:MAG: hypothetical protein PHW80_05615 [Smithellaceae bacterium]|jgi:hypothetical protein|nr:hypothetical protein [Smithellaceae bacterium]MDD3259942.1 hypothetical protein [Smithellaceae bacterium]MDD3848760.1 hypothetical protein [Smithellaceae bacterium]
MKTAALEKAVNRPVGLALTREETKIRVMQSSRLAGIEDRLLDPGAMSLLQVERQRPVEAPEVFQNRKMWQGLQDYHLRMKRCEREGVLPARVEQINAMTVPDGYIPEALSHQDISGKGLRRQAKYIYRAPFFQTVCAHSEYADLPDFSIPKRVMKETLCILNGLRSAGNLFRKNKIQTMIGSLTEANIASRCFGSLWPAGINLYGILRELYPAFHARITGQVPLYVADNMEDLLDTPLDSRAVRGIGKFSIDGQGRFLGLYPTGVLPAGQVTEDCTFVSQDQMGRKAIVNRILEDIVSALKINADRPVLVIDYAGGVGNMSELLLKKIQDMSDANWKDRLWSRVRVAVIDIAEDQLAAGINRFRQMEKQPRYAGICSRIIFLKGDVTQPLQADHIGAMEARFGREAVADSLCLGMTSYTVGALDNITLEGGATIAQAMADEMYKQCWKVYAVDFSSPMWRRSAFLKDTGKWGREYLRIVHGCAQKEDELESMPWIVRLYMKIRFGVSLRSVADFVRFMSIGAALASHYTTVWPDSDGHNAGYCVLEDGTLKKPGILSFAERLQGQGATLYYKSKIWLFATLDLGSAGAGNRAWAFIPGWIADFVVAENKSNR